MMNKLISVWKSGNLGRKWGNRRSKTFWEAKRRRQFIAVKPKSYRLPIGFKSWFRQEFLSTATIIRYERQVDLNELVDADDSTFLRL